MGGHAHKARTLLPRLPEDLPRADTEPLGHVVFGQHDAVAGLLFPRHRHRLASERGIKQNLHAGIKIVHIGMQDHRLHSITNL